MDTRNEYGEGFEAARTELAADGWTRDMARRYLASVSESSSLYGRGYDAFVRLFADGADEVAS